MGKAANGKAMKAKRRKRFERLDPVYRRREELIALRAQAAIGNQEGNHIEAPPPDQWIKELANTPLKITVHTREDIDADVERIRKELLPY